MQDIHYPIPVNLIKTCTVKTLWEKSICNQEKECRHQQYQSQIKSNQSDRGRFHGCCWNIGTDKDEDSELD